MIHDFDTVLDAPIGDAPDPGEFIRAAMRGHFAPGTGSPFWLARTKTLGFDPLTDVKGVDDPALFPNALLPTDHPPADEVVRGADLAMVYGDDEVVRTYSSMATVLPQGAARSRFLVTKDADWTSYPDTIVSSVSAHGGAACVDTTTVFVEGDPAPVAWAIAERLSALPGLPPQDPEAVPPVKPIDEARRVR